MFPRNCLWSLCVLLLLLYVQSQTNDDQTIISEEVIRKMRVKELKHFLKDRGIECTDCVEKVHLVHKVIESRKLPVLKKDEEMKIFKDEDSEDKTNEKKNDDTVNENEDEKSEESDDDVKQKEKNEKTRKKEKARMKKKEKARKKKKEKERKKKEKERKKKNKAKKPARKTFGKLWGKQARKMCEKVKGTTTLEKEACVLLDPAITYKFDRFTDDFLKYGNMYGGGGGLFGAPNRYGGGSGMANMKKTSMLTPYKQTGKRLLKKCIKEAIAAATTARQEQEAWDWKQGKKKAESMMERVRREAAEDVTTADELGSEEKNKINEEEDGKPKAIQERVSDIIQANMMTWLFDTAMRDPKKMSYMGMDLEDLMKRAEVPKSKPEDSTDTSGKTEDNKGEDSRADESKTADNISEDINAGDSKTEDGKSNNKPEHNKPEDSKLEDSKLEDSKLDDSKPKDTETEDTKVEDNTKDDKTEDSDPKFEDFKWPPTPSPTPRRRKRPLVKKKWSDDILDLDIADAERRALETQETQDLHHEL